MIHEQEKLELLTQQVEIASSLMENRLFSREWIYDNIFELNKEKKKEIFDQVIEDQKQVFRMEQITTEGNDPAVTGEKESMLGDTGNGNGAFGMGESDWGGSNPNRYKKEVNQH